MSRLPLVINIMFSIESRGLKSEFYILSLPGCGLVCLMNVVAGFLGGHILETKLVSLLPVLIHVFKGWVMLGLQELCFV